ncbi:MAG TPA: hypothetical protein VME44_18635 [Streptosporangiaceae bacterium]|nr:hypothetical protein [Streptosporangiaceae bacterium]
MNESYAERGYARGGYARGGQRSTKAERSTRAGGVILAAVALLSSFLVLWGLYYATGTGERHKVALAAAGCEPNLLSVNVGCTTVWMLERQWTQLTTSDLQQLNADVADYTVNARRNLAKAESALTAEVTTAKAFDRSLAQFPFPPVVAPPAKTLIQAIQARIKLMGEQARSSSLTQLRSFNDRVNASGAAIQADMTLVHKALYTRPTVNQEP